MNYKKDVWIIGILILLLLVALTSASNSSFDIPIELPSNESVEEVQEPAPEENNTFSIPVELLEISNVDLTINENSVIVKWDTNIDSDSKVEYGLTTSLEQTSVNNNLATEHLVGLISLSEGTYYYKITSCDEYCVSTDVDSFVIGEIIEEPIVEEEPVQEEVIEENQTEKTNQFTIPIEFPEENISEEVVEEPVIEEPIQEEIEEPIEEEPVEEPVEQILEEEIIEEHMMMGFGAMDYSAAEATGTPSATLNFFMNSEGRTQGDKFQDASDFDECPIQLNDYGETTEKCELWDCTEWTGNTADGIGRYCTGGWNCTSWNGVSCETYKCEAWSNTPTSKRIPHCTSGWNCTEWNGDYCSNWNCDGWTTDQGDKVDWYCDGVWDCTSWNGNNCDNWNCTSWASGSAQKLDSYCSGLWDCTAWNGNSCDNWNCTGWTDTILEKYDTYCSGVWNCSAWNGNYCDNWECTEMTITGTVEQDHYCDRWNCSVWDLDKKVCGTWECLEWIAGATAKDDYHCSGSFNCTSWKAFSYDSTPPNITITNPTNGSTVTTNPVYLNATTDENADCEYSTTESFSYGAGTDFTTTGTTSHNTSLGSLSDNTYTYYVKCNDSYGNYNNNTNQKSVTFTVDASNPSSVTNLANQSANRFWIYWNWTNPADADFDTAIIYIGGVWQVNTSNNYYNATGLNPGTDYTITVHTKDTGGNVNDSDVNDTASTLVNNAPSLTSAAVDPTTASSGTLLNVSSTGASDSDSDNYILRCGDASGESDLCNSSSGTGERYCTFNNPWSDDSAHTIYCRIDDGFNLSTERTVVFTSDNTAPNTTLVSVDGDTSSPYWDTSNNSQTILTADVENLAQCRWATTDIIYSSMVNDCSVSSGTANCNLGNVAQIASITYHISCQDQYQNEQTNSENIDAVFGVDYTAPTTYDDYNGSIALPGLEVIITEADTPSGTIIYTWYCDDNNSCTPLTAIDDGENVSFSIRGTNYLRYYSKDEADNTQTPTVTTTIFINSLVVPGSTSYADITNTHRFNVSATPTDVDTSQNITCLLYHRLNETGGYSSKVMNEIGLDFITNISTSEGYNPNDVIQMIVECYDGMEYVNASSSTHTIPNNAPNTPTLNAPDNNTVVTDENTILLNYSSNDLESDTITYYVYGDTNVNPSTLIYSGTATTYNWTLTRNPDAIQNNYWKVLASDSYDNSSFSETRIVIVDDTKGVSITDPSDQDTNRSVNATYTITITNDGAVQDTYNLTINNIDSASTAALNQSSITIASGQNKTVELYVTDDDTVGEYQVNLTAVSDTNSSISDEISITTTVFGILSNYITEPSGSSPPIYYEGQDIALQGYIYDELSNNIEGATATFESIYSSYVYSCTSVIDITNGYYNCTLDTSGMQTTHYYNVRINASKTYYHDGTFTNNTVFLLSDNQEANLTLNKLASIQSINQTHIVYNISNLLINTKGISQQTNLTDPNANQTWSLGDLSMGIVIRSYLLSFIRQTDDYLYTLNKSTAEGYDPVYENNLSAESNQPVLVIPENDELKQLTLIKNLIYQNQTETNITYEVIIEVVNSGEVDLEDIEVTDTDIGLDTKINLTEGQSWQTSSDLLIQKNPQSYIKSFIKTRASASGDIFYSNQLNISIPGYGGPYDVIINSLPNSVETGQIITGEIEVINQNTEVAEDRTLTTWIENEVGTLLDIDIRTIYVGRNQSAYTSVSLTAPSVEGTYYFISELTWPTATANATRSFTVEEEESSSGGSKGGYVPPIEPIDKGESDVLCGDGLCNSNEMHTGIKECLEDCGYDCNGDNVGDSWTRCSLSEGTCVIPTDIKEEIIAIRNKINELENEIIRLRNNGVSTEKLEAIVSALKENVRIIEQIIASCDEYGYARNLIQNIYTENEIEAKPETPTGATVTSIESLNWSFFSFLLLLIIVISLVIGGYYKHEQNKAMTLLKIRRMRLERINKTIDKKIDNYFNRRL